MGVCCTSSCEAAVPEDPSRPGVGCRRRRQRRGAPQGGRGRQRPRLRGAPPSIQDGDRARLPLSRARKRRGLRPGGLRARLAKGAPVRPGPRQLPRHVAYNLRAKKEPEPLERVPSDAQADDPGLSVDGFWLDAGLSRLPPHERKVIELAYFADLSQTQIADRLGIPLGTVKSWTRRGLNHLATLLGEETRE